MRWFQNKTFVVIVVSILIVGLVMAYIPLLFAPEPAPKPTDAANAPEACASLTPIGTPAENGESPDAIEPQNESADETATTSLDLEGLSDFGDEQNALDELDTLLQ